MTCLMALSFSRSVDGLKCFGGGVGEVYRCCSVVLEVVAGGSIPAVKRCAEREGGAGRHSSVDMLWRDGGVFCGVCG